MTTNEQARAIEGTAKLLADAIEHGSRAVERVQLELAARPLELLQQLPIIAAPARAVQAVHTAIVRATHEVIRTAASATKEAIVEVVASVDATAPAEAPRSPETPQP